jgi:drug/metabolite transporter (DMT)-like permease
MPKWLRYALLAVLFWGGWGFASKKIGDAVSASQCQVISTLGLLPIMLVLAVRKTTEPSGRAVRGSAIAFTGGLVGGLGNVAFYWLLGAGEKAATVVPLTSLYPLVTVVLAVLLLRERLNAVQSAGIGLALVAIYLFNAGSGSGLLSRWLAYSLAPIVLWGVAGLLQKMCTNDLSAERSTCWFLGGFVVISAALLLTQPMGWRLGVGAWAWGVALGLLLGLGNLALLAAFASQGKASVITPLSGLYPLVTVPLAVGLLGEKVGGREALAILLSLLAVVALAFEKKPTSVRSQGGCA